MAYNSQDVSLKKRDEHLLLLFCLLADWSVTWWKSSWTVNESHTLDGGKEITGKEPGASDAEDHSCFE